MLSGPAKAWRMAVTAVVVVLLAAGSVWGTDDDFPFGPMKQYATSTKPTGRVGLTAVYGTTADGTDVKISVSELGMRVAELEGQIPRFRREPELLGSLADGYHEKYPDRPRFSHVRLQRNYRQIVNSRVVGRSTDVVARWVMP